MAIEEHWRKSTDDMSIGTQIVIESWRNFGFGISFLRACLIFVLFRIGSMLNLLFLGLDHIFFPGFRRVEVENPIFIIGHPRSGTSFVHQLLSESHQIAAFKAWHIFFPALTSRVFVRPLVRFLSKRGLDELIPSATGHRVALDSVEEEELLFFHKLDTQFAIITTPLGFAEVDHRELRFHDLQSQTKRTKSVRFLKGCFQRHIYYTGRKQIFAQTHFSTHRIKTLLEVFPDARFIYMDRSPFETLPSYFSLNHGVVDQVWGMGNFEAEQISRYFRNRYQASIELCRYFHDVVENEEIDRKKILKIQYDSLRNDLVGVFENIVSFGGLEPSGELRALVQNRAARQPHYRRVHEVRPIEHFGIGEDEVARDFAFLLEGRST